MLSYDNGTVYRITTANSAMELGTLVPEPGGILILMMALPFVRHKKSPRPGSRAVGFRGSLSIEPFQARRRRRDASIAAQPRRGSATSARARACPAPVGRMGVAP